MANPRATASILDTQITATAQRAGRVPRGAKIAGALAVPLAIVGGWVAMLSVGDGNSHAVNVGLTDAGNAPAALLPASPAESAAFDRIRRAVAVDGEPAIVVRMCDDFLQRPDFTVFGRDVRQIRAQFAETLPVPFELGRLDVDLAKIPATAGGVAFPDSRAEMWREIAGQSSRVFSLKVELLDRQSMDESARHQILLTPYRRDSVGLAGDWLSIEWRVATIGELPPLSRLRGRQWTLRVSLRSIDETRPGRLPDALVAERAVDGEWFATAFAGAVEISSGLTLHLRAEAR